MPNLKLQLQYDVADDTFSVDTNIREENICDVVSEFLREQTGAGVDKSTRNDRDVYTIQISLDLSCDKFTGKSNCGNLGLRDGIIMRYLSKRNRNEV